MSKLVPLRDNVIVELEEVAKKTAGGIYLADISVTEKSEGKIVAIGDITSKVELGCKVLFGSYAGNDVIIDGKKHKILKEVELLAVFRD